MQEYVGRLSSGNTFRATPYLVEVTDPEGTVLTTIDTGTIQAVSRNGTTVFINQRNGERTALDCATLDDAGRLEGLLRTSLPAQAADAPRKGGIGKKIGIGCLGVIGLIVVLAVVAALAGGGGDDDDDDVAGAVTPTVATTEPTGEIEANQTSTSGSSSEATATVATASAGQSTEVAEPTATLTIPPATATATSAPEPTASGVGSGRSNPVPVGEIGTTDEWEVQVLEVIRGDVALARIKEANQFNEDPPSGMEYVLVNLRAKYIGTAPEPQRVDFSWLRTTGDARVKWSWPSVVEPEPEFTGELFPGGEVTGWATTFARQGETNMMLVFEPIISTDEGDEVFLALEQGANVQPLAERLAEENDLGFNREEPVPVGEHIVGDTWEVWVIESVRGEEALRRLKEENQFNEDPAPGMEYVLVHIGVRNVKNDSGSDRIDKFSFKFTGDAARVYEFTSLVTPQELGYDVYAGGEIDGWVALQCAVDEQNLMVVYEPSFSFTAEPRYLSIQ